VMSKGLTRSPRHRNRRHQPPVRSKGEWATRGALALGAAIVAYFSMTATLANVLVRADPRAAYALSSFDGRVIAAMVEREFSTKPDFGADSRLAIQSRRALMRDATAVGALNVLALQAQIRSEDVQANRLFDYSNSLSRRELEPQIAMIEKAVDRGDIEGALRRYDIALRTSNRARNILFPVLNAAIAEPKVREALIRLLARRPVWGGAFMEAVPASPTPKAAAEFFLEGRAAGLSIGEPEKARLVSTLVSHDEMDVAWAFYQTFRAKAERDRSRDPNFALETDTPARFDWQVASAPGLSAVILQEANDGYLEFSLPAGAGATVVRQTQLLPPGRYRLEGQSLGIEQPDSSRPYWLLSCRSGGELGRVDVPNSSEGGGVFAGRFVVPAICPAQVLSLVVRASDEIAGAYGRIERVSLVPDRS